MLPVSTPLLPVDELFKQDAVGVALPADAHCFQDPRVAQLHHHPLLAEAQCLPVIIGFDAAHKVRLTHHHLRQQVHQGVLQTHSETTIKRWAETRQENQLLSHEFTLSSSVIKICNSASSIQLFADIDVFNNRVQAQ